MRPSGRRVESLFFFSTNSGVEDQEKKKKKEICFHHRINILYVYVSFNIERQGEKSRGCVVSSDGRDRVRPSASVAPNLPSGAIRH